MLNDYKYAIRTTKQVGNYNKITTYLILHIRKTYEHSGDIADTIEKQEPFNFDPSAPRLKISSIVETAAKLINTRLNTKQNYNCTSSKKSLLHEPGANTCIPIWATHDRPTA